MKYYSHLDLGGFLFHEMQILQKLFPTKYIPIYGILCIARLLPFDSLLPNYLLLKQIFYVKCVWFFKNTFLIDRSVGRDIIFFGGSVVIIRMIVSAMKEEVAPAGT